MAALRGDIGLRYLKQFILVKLFVPNKIKIWNVMSIVPRKENTI
jgi:hypothetical protein